MAPQQYKTWQYIPMYIKHAVIGFYCFWSSEKPVITFMTIRLFSLFFEGSFVQLFQAKWADKMFWVEFSEHGSYASTGDRFVATYKNKIKHFCQWRHKGQLGNVQDMKDFFWELFMLLYGNLIYLKNWKKFSYKIQNKHFCHWRWKRQCTRQHVCYICTYGQLFNENTFIHV